MRVELRMENGDIVHYFISKMAFQKEQLVLVDFANKREVIPLYDIKHIFLDGEHYRGHVE